MGIECRNGQNEFGCKWPECDCIEREHAIQQQPLNTAFWPKVTQRVVEERRIQTSQPLIQVSIRITSKGISFVTTAPADLPPGTYRATLMPVEEPDHKQEK
jgi:hypothetical protein